MKDRRRAERFGRWAETAALLLLLAKGYRLLARRYKTASGEVDLVMRRGAVTAFIEVKARLTRDDALYAVTPRQAQRISAAAELWLARDAKALVGECRFDIVAVSPYLWPTHIPNAFSGARRS